MAKKKKRRVSSPTKARARTDDVPAAKAEPIIRVVRAGRWDATRRNDDLNDYWRWSDSLSIDAALNPSERERFRNRARYEIANNSYAKGVALAISNAVVGSGPKIQVLKPENKKLASEIEWAFCEWAEEIRLAEKLRAMRFARFQDGESFALLCRNPSLDGPVRLDVAPFDAERVSSEYDSYDPRDVDGIKLDDFGNPVSYRVLTRHPGGSGDSERFGVSNRAKRWTSWVESTVYDAKDVVHWFRRETPEQHRGLTELHAALQLFALLRRYTLAVVAAAETAADFASIMYSDGQNFGDGDPKTSQPSPYDEFEITRGAGMVLPDGWKIAQLKAEQPTTTYAEFKRELLGEIGRSLQIPVNLIAGNSSGYNYASGRLDHQEFQKAIRLDQSAAALSVMRPIFAAWWREYALTRRIRGDAVEKPVVAWYWDGFEHVDPTKEAAAQATRLQSFTTNLSIEYAKQGRDWEDELRQVAKERALLGELGLTYQNALSEARNVAPKNEKSEEKNDEDE